VLPSQQVSAAGSPVALARRRGRVHILYWLPGRSITDQKSLMVVEFLDINEIRASWRIVLSKDSL
jgi:hypothetical protein